jgi:hypothetical protein
LVDIMVVAATPPKLEVAQIKPVEASP